MGDIDSVIKDFPEILEDVKGEKGTSKDCIYISDKIKYNII